MEADIILKMVEDEFWHFCFIIDVIVNNNDSTMQAVIKHPSRDARGKVLKSSKEKLDKEIPVSYFLAHPSHHVKVFATHIFSIDNNGKDQ